MLSTSCHLFKCPSSGISPRYDNWPSVERYTTLKGTKGIKLFCMQEQSGWLTVESVWSFALNVNIFLKPGSRMRVVTELSATFTYLVNPNMIWYTEL